MPRLLIKLPHQQNQIFELHGSQISIGRGEGADLSLPDEGISRIHAYISNTSNGYEIRDNQSENGIFLNNKRADKGILSSQDELQIGVFRLIFLGDDQEDKFYRGRAVVYLPAYNAQLMKSQSDEDSTRTFSAKDAEKLLEEKDLLYHGCIIDKRGSQFFPESNPLTFGNERAMITVEGMFVGEKVAIVFWDGSKHCLESKSWLNPMRINGKKAKLQPLEPGDDLRIGSSTYQYRLKK
jgi:pSer/pThr/pTyr-binding forkhead associated (FHA) protein